MIYIMWREEELVYTFPHQSVHTGGSTVSTYIPFLRGRSLVRIALKSGLSSGFSAQHSTRQSRTKLKLFSSSSSCGLGANHNIISFNYIPGATQNLTDKGV